MVITTPAIDERLERWLRAHAIPFEVHPHPLALTAVAKVVGVGRRTPR